ncbi:unnamed protein product [Nyctereutes procyonoides]|uniref:(raccoon dog) hypothetical protein n=1 Tax=Nyctereutes procyonoides TaxID=34880 RepID=A0A811ZIU4_NYCPR|nr:unnamed protein product [Nyctereutes procyonoides]
MLEWIDLFFIGLRYYYKCNCEEQDKQTGLPAVHWEVKESLIEELKTKGRRKQPFEESRMNGPGRGRGRRRPCEEGGRDWSDVAASQRIPAVTRSQKRPGTDSTPGPPESRTF